MGTLYDQYRLTNSTQIPQFAGSVVPELTKVAQTMQERYDVGLQQQDLLDQAIKTATASPFDKETLESLKNEYRTKMKGYAEKGDYENIWRNVALDARDFVNRYKPIAANQAAISAYQEEMDKDIKSGRLTPQMAKARMDIITDTYTGLKYNPETGQYENRFSGANNAKYVDMPKKINEWLQHTHPFAKEGTVRKDVSGYYVETSSGSKRLPWESVKDKHGNIVQVGVKDIVESGMATDPEVQAYLNQEKEFAPYYSGFSNRITDEQAMGAVSPAMMPVFEELVNSGYSPKDALKTLMGELHVSKLKNDIMTHGMKGVVNETSSSYKVMGETEETSRNRVAEMNAPSRFLVPSADFRLDDKEKDPVKLRESVQTLTNNIADLEAKLKTAPPEDQKLLRSQIIAAKNELASKQSIISGTLNETATTLGFKDIDDMLEKTVPKSFGYTNTKGQRASDGISREEVIAAIKSGALTNLKTGMLKGTGIPAGIIEIPGKGFVTTKDLGISDKAAQAFIGTYEQAVKTNAEHYAMKPMDLQLDEKEAKGLNTMILGNPSAFQWFKSGSNKPSDAPDDFDITSIKVIEKDGKTFLQAREMEHKKKEGRVPGDATYVIQIDPGSNVGTTIAKNLIGNGKKKISPDMMRTAALLSGYSFETERAGIPTYGGDIANLQMHDRMVVRNEDGDVFASIKLEPHKSDPGKIRYVLYDENDQIVTDKGNHMQSDNLDEISQFLQNAIANSIKDKKQK